MASADTDASASPSAEPASSEPTRPLSVQQFPDYQALYEEVKGKPCQVTFIDKQYESGRGGSYDGDDGEARRPIRTKPQLIDRELQCVYDATTLEEIHAALTKAAAALRELDTFKAIIMAVTEQPEDEPDACTVTLDVEEKNWYRVHAGTYLQGAETTVELGLGLHNPSGYAEDISLTGEFSNERSSQFAVNWTQPRPYGLPLVFTGRAHQAIHIHQKASSFTEQLRGMILGAKSGTHSLQYELGWRNLSDASHRASPKVLEQIGDDLVSVVRYSWLTDRRDDAANPQSGWAVKSTSEVGGLGPQAVGGTVAGRFLKQQVDFQGALPVAPGVALCLTASAGLMLPWGPDGLSRPTCISERFHLGGTSTLRGFGFKGVGPTDERRSSAAASAATGDGNGSQASTAPVAVDALGGDLFTSILAALTFQIPMPASPLKLHGHLFVNGGNNVQLSGTGQSLRNGFERFSQTLRWSAGAGLVLPTWFGRFEANYVVLLSHQQQDRLRPGVRLGFSTTAFM